MLTSSPVSPLARRFVMASRGQRCRASGLRPHHPEDLLQRHDTGPEGVTIAVDDLGQRPDQRFRLFVCQFKVHGPERGLIY
jgi:hypothetical protein